MVDNSDSRNKISQLLIIGNGFDLHGGLHSDFSHFIESVYPDMVKTINGYNDLSPVTVLNKINKFLTAKIDTLLINSNFNYWAQCLLLIKLYLKHHKTLRNISWCDIENCLTTAIKPSRVKNDNIQYFFYIGNIMNNLHQLIIYCVSRRIMSQEKNDTIIDQANEMSKNVYRHTDHLSLLLLYKLLENEHGLIKKYNVVNEKESISYYVNNAIKSYDYYGNINSFLSYDSGYKLHDEKHIKNLLLHYFKIELSDFEISFNNYLNKLIKNFSNKNYLDYYDYGKKLIYKLLCDVDYDDKYFLDAALKPISFSLLNFNYTMPTKDIDNSEVKYSNRNIHGHLISLNKKNESMNNFKFANIYFNHPIIGIDGAGIPANKPEYEFTKDYRIMRCSRNYMHLGFLPKSLKYIKFFGHSLGIADYSYFKDIFDKYKIYDMDNSPRVILVFYYAQYKDSLTGKMLSDDQVAVSQYNNICKLFQRYCDDLQNKKHISINSNELLNRLLLEGCLIIRNIKNINDHKEIRRNLNS